MKIGGFQAHAQTVVPSSSSHPRTGREPGYEAKDWVGICHLKTNIVVPPVSKGRVEHEVHVEQPPTVVGVTSKYPEQSSDC